MHSLSKDLNINFQGLDFVFAYADDTLVASRKEEEHIRNFVDRLILYDLNIKISKTPLKSRLNGILDLEIPINVEKLHTFLGIINCYHRYVLQLAHNLSSLPKIVTESDKTKVKELH